MDTIVARASLAGTLLSYERNMMLSVRSGASFSNHPRPNTIILIRSLGRAGPVTHSGKNLVTTPEKLISTDHRSGSAAMMTIPKMKRLKIAKRIAIKTFRVRLFLYFAWTLVQDPFCVLSCFLGGLLPFLAIVFFLVLAFFCGAADALLRGENLSGMNIELCVFS